MTDRPISIRLTAKSKAGLKQLATSTEKATVFKSLLGVMGRRGLRIAGGISKDMLSGQRLKRRTGSLARSITAKADMIEGLPGVRVGIFEGPALKYAGVQEFGTFGVEPQSPYPTIKPKNAKALAAPVGEALTPAGVARYQSPRQYPGELDFAPFKTSGDAIGALYEKDDLAEEQKAARREKRPVSLRNVEAVYILLRKLDIDPKHFLADGMYLGLPNLSEDVGDEIARLMRSAG